MNPPSELLPQLTKVITSSVLGSTAGLPVGPSLPPGRPSRLTLRKPGRPGVVVSYGKDKPGTVYWVRLLGDVNAAPYAISELELYTEDNAALDAFVAQAKKTLPPAAARY